MKILSNFILLLIIVSQSYGFEVESRKLKPTLKEHGEFDRQLIILNKPPLMSFTLKNGDIIDCINIYKQPAFDNPLLKNHKLQRKPTYVPKEMRMRREDPSRLNKVQGNQREFEGCPYETVPFKRTTKEDLIRAKYVSTLNRSRAANPSGVLTRDVHFGLVTTPTNDPSQKFYGAATSISVYNLTSPPLHMTKPQISESMLWIGSGVDGPYNSIEYGWATNPMLYGDGQPRTYSLWTADGFKDTGCYNALCPGYVQVSQKRIMGEIDHPVSSFGSDVYAMEFTLVKDPHTSNWWLFENLGDEANEPVGYWPQELFPGMKESATIVQIGGKVNSPGGTPQSTPMGSGYFVKNDFTRTCYASNIQFLDANFKYYDPIDVDMQVIADIPDVYRADYLGYAGKDHPERGYTLLFGGPGGWDY